VQFHEKADKAVLQPAKRGGIFVFEGKLVRIRAVEQTDVLAAIVARLVMTGAAAAQANRLCACSRLISIRTTTINAIPGAITLSRDAACLPVSPEKPGATSLIISGAKAQQTMHNTRSSPSSKRTTAYAKPQAPSLSPVLTALMNTGIKAEETALPNEAARV